jgi:hypothetical protein
VTVHRDETIRDHATFIWAIAELLRGGYKQSEYGRVILPLVVLRRLDCVLDPTKDKVLETATELVGKVENIEPLLRQAACSRGPRCCYRRRSRTPAMPGRSRCWSATTAPATTTPLFGFSPSATG